MRLTRQRFALRVISNTLGTHRRIDAMGACMKQAFCSECGSYVRLDESGACPLNHPKPCYRDIRDSTGHSTVSSPTSSAVPEPPAIEAPASRTRLWLILGSTALVVVTILVAGGLMIARKLGAEPSAPQTAVPAVPAVTTTTPSVAPPERIVPNPDGSYPPTITPDASYTAPSEQQKLWALATSGLLMQVNGERHDLLSGCDMNAANVAIAKQGLAEWWGIESREDLLGSLTWIEQGGHRRNFDTIVYALEVATPEDLSAISAETGSNPETANQVKIAQQYGWRLGAKSIAGWDFSRYVFLCRRGFLIGYLSEQEAWERIMPAARLMQNSFSSWKDLGDNYMIGRTYWSLKQSQENATWRDAERELLTDSDSPWVRLPWDTDLGQSGRQ